MDKIDLGRKERVYEGEPQVTSDDSEYKTKTCYPQVTVPAKGMTSGVKKVICEIEVVAFRKDGWRGDGPEAEIEIHSMEPVEDSNLDKDTEEAMNDFFNKD